MAPTTEQIKALTPVQRLYIEELQQAGYVKALNSQRRTVFRRLVEIGAACYDPDCQYQNEFLIDPDWVGIDVSVVPRGPRTLFPPVVPDPPKERLIRAPAEYSNVSREERIDQILNSK